VSTGTERLQTALWVMERNLGWIAAAQVKVGVIVAIDTGMLGAWVRPLAQAMQLHELTGVRCS
jgi:hypothetical protein